MARSRSRTADLLSAAFALFAILVLLAPAVLAQEDGLLKVHDDREKDVLVDSKKGPLTRLMDLETLDEKADDDIVELGDVDISSLKIDVTNSYFNFILTVEGKVQYDSNFTYYICGYSRKDPKESETFDFIISYSGGVSEYMTWMEGKYVRGANVSSVKLEGRTLNLSMHVDHFILGAPTEPYLICAVVVLYGGEGKDRYIDFVRTDGEKENNDIDETTWIIIQVVFIGILVITMLILWNFWAKKRDVQQEGGVCPKCEAKLDKNLDFCPHCGLFIRGPEADKANPKPRIVHPLDLENEE